METGGTNHQVCPKVLNDLRAMMDLMHQNLTGTKENRSLEGALVPYYHQGSATKYRINGRQPFEIVKKQNDVT